MVRKANTMSLYLYMKETKYLSFWSYIALSCEFPWIVADTTICWSRWTDYRWEYALGKEIPLSRESSAPVWTAFQFVQ